MGSNFYILFVIIAAGVVPCVGLKKNPRTSPIVQIILFYWSFAISKNIQSIKKCTFGAIFKQCFHYLTPFGHLSLI